MTESVRLVVWDLDETFWKGTLTEGGIREYVQAHHDLVIELSRRGIINSICSKNDASKVLPILEDRGIRNYFVFPSISWEPKGSRLADLVQRVQLRPQSVMFIDDNPSNRGEVALAVPGIQVESEEFISHMLEDPRFQGKDDKDLSRLKQYQLLETRDADRSQVTGNEEGFLRSSNIRVLIDYDVEANLDRAVELVNRTNQLNYTKNRLSENLTDAKAQLLRQLKSFGRVGGLVRVADRYGDYGYVGFFLTGGWRKTIVEGAVNTQLEHFCFSCRTLGMLIELWTYQHLGRPELETVGEVLTDLSVDRRVDWVTQVSSLDADAPKFPAVADRILAFGGCEAHVVGSYLSPYAVESMAHGNYAANGLFVRVNACAIALGSGDRNPQLLAAEAARLGLPLQLEFQDVLRVDQGSTLFVFNFGADAHGSERIGHKVYGWQFMPEPAALPGRNLLMLSEEELAVHFADPAVRYSEEQRQHIRSAARHVRDNYERVAQPSLAQLVRDMVALIERVPVGSKVIVLVPHHEVRPKFPSREIEVKRQILEYDSAMRQALRGRSYAAVVAVSDVIRGVDDLLDADHYSREVYLRIAHQIVATASTLSPRPSAPNSGTLHAVPASRQRSQLADLASGETVAALYQAILGRDIDSEAYQAECDLTHTIETWVTRLVGSDEFAMRFAQKRRA